MLTAFCMGFGRGYGTYYTQKRIFLWVMGEEALLRDFSHLMEFYKRNLDKPIDNIFLQC